MFRMRQGPGYLSTFANSIPLGVFPSAGRVTGCSVNNGFQNIRNITTNTNTFPCSKGGRSQPKISRSAHKLSPKSENRFWAKANNNRNFLCSGNPHFYQGQRRFASTSSFSNDKPTSFVEELSDKVEIADKVIPSNLLEYMELNAVSTTGSIFSDTGPVLYVVDLLCALKDLDGMTWIQVILYTTIVTRLLTGLPIAITQQRSLKRLEDLKPEIMDLANELKKETGYAIKKFGWDEKTAKRQYTKSYKKHWRKLMEEHNCHPMRSLCLGLLQIPIWISFSSALRNIVFGLPLPRTEDLAIRWFQMHQEGTPWVQSLTVCDPYVLPVIFLVANLTNIRLHTRNRPTSTIPPSTLQRALPWIFSGAIVSVSIFACFVPSAITMYWATSSSVALTQNIVLLHPGLRKRFKMPIYSPASSTTELPLVKRSKQ